MFAGHRFRVERAAFRVMSQVASRLTATV